MKFLSYSFCFITFCSFANDVSLARNMIILLDQEDNHENIGNPYWHFLSCKFQSALQEKCSPILINASLVNAFIEKRKSIEQMSKIRGTEEEKALDTYHAINQRLNIAYAHFRGRGFNPLHAKQLMIDEVNKQFYSRKAVIESQNKPISSSVEQALRAYVTHFQAQEWNIYTNNKSLYLFVPKSIESPQNATQGWGSGSPASWEQTYQTHLGLKLSTLTKVANIEDAVKLYFDSKHETKYLIGEQLRDFFITKADPNYKPYHWNIILSGHGGTRYVPESDSYAQVTLADLALHDFQKVNDFFQHEVKTHSLHYATCFGSGKRFQLAFDKAQYDFPIISDCTSDGESYCMVRNFKLPNHNGKELTESDIISDKNGDWKLNLDYGYNWSEYFNQISHHSFEDDRGNNLCHLYNTLNTITENMMSNIPQIRLPGTTSFIPALSKNTSVINDAFLKYHQEQTTAAYTLADRFAILIQSACIPFPLIFDNKYNAPHIISLIPGPSKHHFEKLIFKNADHALNAFWPVPGDRFDRYFVIEKIEFPYDKNSEVLKLLQLNDGPVALQNLMIHAQTEKILRIFLQTKTGQSFMIVANKTDVFAPEISIKGVHQLTPEVAKTYLSRYNQIRSEILRNTPKAEFILSNVEGGGQAGKKLMVKDA